MNWRLAIGFLLVLLLSSCGGDPEGDLVKRHLEAAPNQIFAMPEELAATEEVKAHVYRALQTPNGFSKALGLGERFDWEWMAEEVGRAFLAGKTDQQTHRFLTRFPAGKYFPRWE